MQDSVLAAWMYAPGSQPDQVSIQISCPKGILAPRDAYNLGKRLTSLGKAARKVEPMAPGTTS